jgi:hypothetical protein
MPDYNTKKLFCKLLIGSEEDSARPPNSSLCPVLGGHDAPKMQRLSSVSPFAKQSLQRGSKTLTQV